ncbi:MAG: penicillin-binding transpeptidase domain-containing protein [Myxococcales bacterium]
MRSRLAVLVLGSFAGVALAAGATPAPPAPPAPAPSDPVPAPGAPEDLPPPPRATLDDLVGAARYDAVSDRYVAALPDGSKEPLTLDPGLQQAAERLLDGYRAPLAELVALDPSTGRILAWVRRTADDPASQGLDVEAFPAASVFKLVTASALLERGVTPEEEVCYHGGKHRLAERLLEDDDRRDRRCVSLAEAIARSANVAIAKLADRDLDPIWLRAWADRLLFNRPLPSPLALPVSTALVPDGRFEFAETAAGFGDVKLTPLHGAALAAAIGNDGVLAPPHLVEGDAPVETERLLPAPMARTLTEMMALTVRQGTAHKAFRSRAARALDAAGKTGSLASRKPYRDYSWFVGFAPSLGPRIAVAAVVVNGLRWRVHASTLASAAMQSYLHPPRLHPLTAGR